MKENQIKNLSGYLSDTEPSKAELRNNALNRAILDLIFIIDEDGRYIETNDSDYLKLFFPSSLKIIGETFDNIFPKEVAQSFHTFLQKALQSGECLSMEYPLVGLDGKDYFFESRCVALEERINGKRATIWVIREITARKNAEQLAIDRGVELALINQQFIQFEEREKADQVLRLALADGEFELYYQPKVDLQTGRVLGVEALVRWQHPQRGLLLPSAFLPSFEEHSFSIEFDWWIIHKALRQGEVWQKLSIALPISINIHAKTIEQDGFAIRLKKILAHYPQLPHGSFQLELLETTAIKNLDGIIGVIIACREFGVSFALDDFGTGYSSLTYLKNLPVDTLKIDRSFVNDILDDASDRALIKSVIDLAQQMGIIVVAEGVETKAHGDLLLKMGCQIAQGFGIAKPMQASAIAKWIADWESNPV
ncbi:sensor domain-containing protein [Polynucleobacter sinensis]|uniref:sensor domain-containing protein n=1 Tax=Polynucleobacter sinensis TaxID=1743157 RepID=UPI00078659A8|nr:EAL domain-containing protein [Polynucleobacter sinensis]